MTETENTAFVAEGKAFKTVFWSALGFNEGDFDRVGLLGTFITAPTLP